MRTRVQEKSAPCLERNGTLFCALLTQVLFPEVISVNPKEFPVRKPCCIQASIYFQGVSRGTLRWESAAENLPEGLGAAARGAFISRPPWRTAALPASFAAATPARDSVKHAFMRNWDHRCGFGAQGATPPRIRHFVGMSSWGPGRKERER